MTSTHVEIAFCKGAAIIYELLKGLVALDLVFFVQNIPNRCTETTSSVDPKNLFNLYFYRNAGDSYLEVQLVNEETRQEIPVKITDNGDRTYTVDYETNHAGLHTVTLLYGGIKVHSTPIKFRVHPNVDVSKIKVDGLEPSKYRKILLQGRTRNTSLL